MDIRKNVRKPSKTKVNRKSDFCFLFFKNTTFVLDYFANEIKLFDFDHPKIIDLSWRYLVYKKQCD